MKRLLPAAAALGLVAFAIKKKCSQQRDQWHGLSENDVREKLDHRLPSRMPDDRRAAMTDKIVGRMRDRGVIVDEADTSVDGAVDDVARDGVDIDLTAQPTETDDATTTVKS